MDIVDFAKLQYKRLDELKEGLSEYLNNGYAKTYDDYQYIVGKIEGLSMTREELKALLDKVNDGDE